jgi:hypothetical protein
VVERVVAEERQPAGLELHGRCGGGGRGVGFRRQVAVAARLQEALAKVLRKVGLRDEKGGELAGRTGLQKIASPPDATRCEENSPSVSAFEQVWQRKQALWYTRPSTGSSSTG